MYLTRKKLCGRGNPTINDGVLQLGRGDKKKMDFLIHSRYQF